MNTEIMVQQAIEYTVIGILVLFFGGFIILSIYKIVRDIIKKVKNGTFSFDSFMDLYQEAVIRCLKEIIPMLNVNIDDYSSKEEYEKAIADKGVKTLKDKFEDLGIPESVIAIFNDEALSNIILTVYHANGADILDVVDKKDIEKHKELYDEDEVKKLESKSSL